MNKYEDVEEKVILSKLSRLSRVGEVGKSETDGSLQEYEVLKEDIAALKAQSQIYAHRTIVTNIKFFPGIVVFVKKVIRKCLKWYIDPVCVQQSEVNGAIVRYNMKTLSALEAQKKEIDDLHAELAMAKDQIIELSESVGDISKEILVDSKENFWLSREAYAQSGEDIIVEYILMVLGLDIKNCKYLDLGANHARELSNTYSLYRKGARGVLVEANPALIPELKFYRHHDIIINKCIAEKEGETIPFYIVNGDGLASMDHESVEKALSINDGLKVEKVIEVETVNVNTILEQYFMNGPEILSIDIEGESLNALKSINWNRTRPLIVIVEMIEYSMNLNIDYKDHEIQQFMEEQDYSEYAFTGINSIYIDRRRVVKESEGEHCGK